MPQADQWRAVCVGQLQVIDRQLQLPGFELHLTQVQFAVHAFAYQLYSLRLYQPGHGPIAHRGPEQRQSSAGDKQLECQRPDLHARPSFDLMVTASAAVQVLHRCSHSVSQTGLESSNALVRPKEHSDHVTAKC